MSIPIAAVAAVGATTPAPSARVDPMQAAMNPALSAFHDVDAAKDFADLASRAPAAGAGHSGSMFSTPLHDSVRSAMARGTVEIAQGSDMGPLSDSATQVEIAERVQRVVANNTRLTAALTSSQIEFSVGLALSNALLDTVHSLLKSNE